MHINKGTLIQGMSSEGGGWAGRAPEMSHSMEPPPALELQGQREEVVGPEPRRQDHPVGAGAVDEPGRRSWSLEAEEISHFLEIPPTAECEEEISLLFPLSPFPIFSAQQFHF